MPSGMLTTVHLVLHSNSDSRIIEDDFRDLDIRSETRTFRSVSASLCLDRQKVNLL